MHGERAESKTAPPEAARTLARQCRILGRGRGSGLNKPWNVTPVQPLRRAGGETLVFIRHLVLSRLSCGVVSFFRQPARFLRPEMPVQWVRQQFRHLTHSRFAKPSDYDKPHPPTVPTDNTTKIHALEATRYRP